MPRRTSDWLRSEMYLKIRDVDGGVWDEVIDAKISQPHVPFALEIL